MRYMPPPVQINSWQMERIGEIAPGQAASTEAFQMQTRYLIHTVGPVWIDGRHGEREILRSCYEQSVALAAELHCDSIAFPLIASGVYGFPKDVALSIALSEIGKFLLTHEMKVILIVFDRRALELSEDLVAASINILMNIPRRSCGIQSTAGPVRRNCTEGSRTQSAFA